MHRFDRQPADTVVTLTVYIVTGLLAINIDKICSYTFHVKKKTLSLIMHDFI